jgi:Lrp/AsnC family leucine-responsive transcriptional regulator
LGIQAFISVILSRHESDIIRKFEEGIRQIPNVRACYNLTGRFDYLLHVATRDLDQLGKLIKTRITALPGFGKSESFLVLSEVKPDKGVPVAADLPGRSKKSRRLNP